MATGVWILLGLVLLVGGAELLVRGAGALAARWGVPPLIIGLTVVAFGTSSPELAVSVGAAWTGQGGIAVGNVVGSNIFNILAILGAAAVIAPLTVHAQLIRLDVPVMIAVSALVWLLAADGALGLVDCGLLLVGLAGYVGVQVRLGLGNPGSVDVPAARGRAVLPARSLGEVVVGLALLLLGSRWLMGGAVTLAEAAGVSQTVIGLTLVAAGTSLPELATSVLAAWRGQRDMAVGNVVGSNVFNLLAILGAAGMVAGGGLAVEPVVWRFDLVVMVAVAGVCLPVFFTGGLIARWEGALLLLAYAAYTGQLVLSATGHAAERAFAQALVGYALPLAAITALVLWLGRPGRARDR